MLKTSKDAELDAILAVADAMCLAARTAPKAKGWDCIVTAVVTGRDQEQLAKRMEDIAGQQGVEFFGRDAGNVRDAQAVVLIGAVDKARVLNELCGFCGFANCTECFRSGGHCAYTAMDLGIAIGSAAATAADARADNRILFSGGRAALDLKLLGDEAVQAVAIPLSASGKSPFFDRKKKP